MTVADFWMIGGTLEPIDFDGYADDRFPLELAERVIKTFSKEGDWVLDPFAGLGTTLFAAAGLGRNAVGFEPDPQRARYVTSRLTPPHGLVAEPIQSITLGQFPPFDLIFTSPPYVMVNLEDDPWGPTYFDDMRDIFTKLSRLMAPTGRIVVEVSNVSTEDGFRPLVAELGDCLRDVFPQIGEIVRINTGPALAGPGTKHSSLLVFAPS